MTLVALLAVLRLASGIATFHAESTGLDPPPVSLPSVASLADGDDGTGGYAEASADGVLAAVMEWGGDAVLDPFVVEHATIDSIEVVIRAKRATVLGVAGSGTVRAAVDQALVGAAQALSTSVADFTFAIPGTWTVSALAAARFGWRIDATTGNAVSVERGHVVDYRVNVYGTIEEVSQPRTATLRAGTRTA